jgi:hypothetical protein
MEVTIYSFYSAGLSQMLSNIQIHMTIGLSIVPVTSDPTESSSIVKNQINVDVIIVKFDFLTFCKLKQHHSFLNKQI